MKWSISAPPDGGRSGQAPFRKTHADGRARDIRRARHIGLDFREAVRYNLVIDICIMRQGVAVCLIFRIWVMCPQFLVGLGKCAVSFVNHYQV